MWDHELKATKQRVLELEEKKQDLQAFEEVLDKYRETGVGEGDVLAYMEACKPVLWRAMMGNTRLCQQRQFCLHGIEIMTAVGMWMCFWRISGAKIARKFSICQDGKWRLHRPNRGIDSRTDLPNLSQLSPWFDSADLLAIPAHALSESFRKVLCPSLSLTTIKGLEQTACYFLHT